MGPIAERQRPNSRRDAFTLIELLVTVVILSTGIVLILQAFQTSMVALAESRDALRSAGLRHALLAQAELDVLGAGGAAGIPDSALRARYPDYTWRVDTRAESEPACTNSPWRQYELSVMVQHEVTGREAEAATWVLVEEKERVGEVSRGL